MQGSTLAASYSTLRKSFKNYLKS